MSLRRELALAAAVLAVASMIVAAIALIGVARLTDFHSVTVPANRTINGDFEATGGSIELLGTVRGDVDVRAWFVNQVGPVDGNVSVIAGRAELRGPIGGSVHAYGASVSLYGTVDGDVEVTGGQVTLVEGARINGDLIVHGGAVTLVARSQLAGQLRGEAVQMTIEGEIGNGIDFSVWELTIAPGATIHGPVSFESRSELSLDRNATVDGPIVRADPANRIRHGSTLFWRHAAIPRSAVMLVIGMLLVLVAPRTMAQLADRPRHALPTTAAVGLGVTLFVPVALAVLALFVVTIPLVVFLGSLYLLAAYLSMAILGLTLGRTLTRRPGSDRGRGTGLAALVVGVTILAVVRQAPVPYADAIIAVLLAVLGLGAVAQWVAGTGAERVRPHPHPVASFVLGVAVGLTAVLLALVAVIAAVTGSVAAVVTLSRNAIFAWEIAPRRLAAGALLSAGCSLAIGMWALVAVIRARSAELPH